MSTRLHLLIILLLAVTVYEVGAQSNQTLYFMNLPQRTTLNPVLRPTNKVFVGLPVVSDISVNLDNNFLGFSDLFLNGVISDSTIAFQEEGEPLDNFLDKLNKANSIEPQVSVQLFGLGFTVLNDLYITLDLTERIECNIVFPGDMLKLGIQGSAGFNGHRVDLSALRTDAKYFHEIGLGASKDITEKLRIGVRGKILFGVATGSLDNNGLGLKVNDDNSYTLDADMALNICGPVIAYAGNDGSLDSMKIDREQLNSAKGVVSYLTRMGNPGLGIDVGAEYRFTDRLSVSAALTDLGFIRWKTDERVKLITDSKIELSGNSMQDVYDETLTFEDMIQQFTDTLLSTVSVVDDPEPFTTFLPMGLTFAGSYNLTDFLSFGLLSQTKFIGKQAHESVTLSTNLNFGNVFSTTLAYTAANQRFDNVGLGLAFRGGYFQFYTLVDNIPLKWTKATSGESTFRIPENWNTVHLRMGLNFVFGNKIKERLKKSKDLSDL